MLFPRKLILFSVVDSSLEVSNPPADPFLIIPAVVSRTEDGGFIFGEDAEDDVEATWINGLPRTDSAWRPEFDAFFKYVFKLPKVSKSIGRSGRIMFCFPYSLRETLGRPVINFNWYRMGDLIDFPLLAPLTISHERVAGWSLAKRRICLHISTNYTSLVQYDSKNMYLSRKSRTIGFGDVVDFFIKLLCEKGYDLTSVQGRKVAKELVKEYCYVANDFVAECQRVEALNGVIHEVKLEDGSVIQLGKECFYAPEVLFNPSLLGMDTTGIDILFAKLLQKGNVILVGNFAQQLAGLKERLQREVSSKSAFFKNYNIMFFNADLKKDALQLTKDTWAAPQEID